MELHNYKNYTIEKIGLKLEIQLYAVTWEYDIDV